MFVLLMLFLFKYIDDMIGKGFAWYIILELMMYASAYNVAMALPLSVLLSTNLPPPLSPLDSIQQWQCQWQWMRVRCRTSWSLCIGDNETNTVTTQQPWPVAQLKQIKQKRKKVLILCTNYFSVALKKEFWINLHPRPPAVLPRTNQVWHKPGADVLHGDLACRRPKAKFLERFTPRG